MIFVLLQMLYTPYFYLRVRNDFGDIEVLPSPKHDLESLIHSAKETKPGEHIFLGKETHTLLTQSGLGLFNPIAAQSLIELVVKPNGSLYRERRPDGSEGEPYLGPSGDGMSSWVFNYILWNIDNKPLVKKVATHYLKNCFGILWNEKGKVSNRSSNFGLNVTAEEWTVKGKNIGFSLANPLTGPGVLTSQAILELAASELGGVWKLIAKLHYVLAGVWYFKHVPAMYTKDVAGQIFYTQHICALNLWSLCKLGKDYKSGLSMIDSNGPRGRPQPWITSLAYNVGLVDQERKQLTINYLRSYTGAVTWPQMMIADSNFKTGETGPDVNYTMMGLAALMLSK